jgi:hypothetical protein
MEAQNPIMKTGYSAEGVAIFNVREKRFARFRALFRKLARNVQLHPERGFYGKSRKAVISIHHRTVNYIHRGAWPYRHWHSLLFGLALLVGQHR